MATEIILDRITFAGEDPTESIYTERFLRRSFSYFKMNYSPWFPKAKNAEILDFGCGSGSFLLYLSRQGYTQLTGFEPDSRYAKSAQTHVPAKIVTDSDERQFLEAHPQTYDFILCRQVLYYLPKNELVGTLRLLKKALKPGGILLIETFNSAGFTGNWPRYNDFYIENTFSEHSLRQVVEGADLKVISLETERFSGSGVKLQFWKLLRKCWWVVLRFIYVIERGMDPLNPTLFGKNLILVAKDGTSK